MIYIIKKPPWEIQGINKDKYQHGGYKEQQEILDHTIQEKKKWTSGGKWKQWEEGRKKRLRERRDYFRNHPDKNDDYSGV